MKIGNNFLDTERTALSKTIFLIDILYMKDINEIYGFKNGDYILEQLEYLLKNRVIEEIDKKIEKNFSISVNNVYSDVFELIVNRDLNLNDIDIVKNIIFENISAYKFKLLEVEITIHIDITVGCSKSSDSKLKIYAEKALHNAKLNNISYMYCDSYLYKNEEINRDIFDTLVYNVKNKLVEPHFQAILCNKTNKIVKYETLMRLYDKNGDILYPYDFIKKSKKYRLYYDLMKILIDKTIKYIKQYNIHVNINLDYIDINNYAMNKLLIEKIVENNVGEYITFEILENEQVSSFQIVNNFINDVKKYGVKIAIDDFGTGFSNYEHILNLNIDYLKIDGSLIKRIDEDIYTNLIKSIILFCKEQKIEVVAEFVSDLKTLRYVNNLGIDYSQGYHIGKPTDIKTLMEKK